MSPPNNYFASLRLDVMRTYLDIYSRDKDTAEKSSRYGLLKSYAFILPEYRDDFEAQIRFVASKHPELFNRFELPNTELMRGDTWFWLHPEKVAGTEQVTTSMQFPLTLKGSKEDVIRTIRAGIAAAPTAPSTDHDAARKRMKLKMKMALALLKLKDGKPAAGAPAGTVVKIFDRPEGENPVYSVQIDGHQTYLQRIGGNSFDGWYEMKKGRGKNALWEYANESDRFNAMGEGFSKKEAVERLEKKYRKGAPLAGLSGVLAGLGELSDATRAAVNGSALAIRGILERSKEERSYSNRDALSFEEVMKLYNPGISEDDIRAWVWFKRSIGVPMPGGWKKYYLRDTGTQGTLLTTTKPTPILDNAWRVIATVPAGVVIGKPTKKSHEYKGINYRIFRSDDNAIRFVNDADVKESKSNFSTSQEDLDKLVNAGSLFYIDGELLPYPLYAFGNMYDRQLELDKDRDALIGRYGQDVFDKHEACIKACRPRLLSVMNPDPRERMKVLAISTFAKEFRVKELVEGAVPQMESYIEKDKKADKETENDRGISIVTLFRYWMQQLPDTDFREVKALDMIKYYLNDKPLSRDLNEAEKQTIDMYAGLECEELFARFLHTCLLFDDQQKFDFSWNRRYNAQASVPYHRVPVGFECSARFKSGLLQFTPAQREAIAFMETTGSGILAYDVGVGKTMSAIITLANALYAGKCTRPLVVVPNATYGKWIKEIIGFDDNGVFVPGVLSNTGITINDWYNLGSTMAVAKQLTAGRAPAIPAKSITVVTYEGLSKIGLSNKALGLMAAELDAILYQTGGTEKSARGKEKKQQGAAEIVGGSNAGTICDLDVLGFDYVVVDEAHNFKNIFGQVPTDAEGNKRYKISGSESARGQKLFFLANYVQRRYGRNVLLLTATPFTNSPLEIYSMLSLVGYETMVRMGLHNLEVFCETFVLQTLEYVNSYDNTVRLDAVVKSFNNRLILQKLIFNHIAYKTGEEAGVVRPCKVNLPRTTVMAADGRSERLGPGKQTLTYLSMSGGQQMNQDEIIDALVNRDPKDIGAIMRALGQSLDNALSPHLVKGYGEPRDCYDYVEQSPKLDYVMKCVASVKKWHEDRNQPVSGQVIYMNRGKDYFPLLREYLIEEVGYQASVSHNGRKFCEVEIISSGLSADKKEGIKDAFLAGVVKVLIGTATIREGIDLQTRGTVLYNCYPDWNPTDVKQLEGRIWRQGNEFGFVRVVMPLVQNSMDVFVFQKLEEKTSRVNDLWYRGDRGNVLDQESLDPQEVKFALFTDVTILVKMEIDRLLKEAKRRVSVAQADLQSVASYSADRKAYLGHKEGIFKEIKKHLEPSTGISWDKRLSQFFDAEGLIKEFKESLDDWRMKAEAMIASPERDDRGLLDLARHTLRLLDKGQLPNWTLTPLVDAFRVALAKVRKAEKSFLTDRGLDLETDPEGAREALAAEVDRLKAEEVRIDTDKEFQASIWLDVEDKKARLQITGASVAQRAREFGNLNHLLGIKAGMNGGSCVVPPNPDADTATYAEVVPPAQLAPAADADKARKRLKLKMKMALALLKLKAQTA